MTGQERGIHHAVRQTIKRDRLSCSTFQERVGLDPCDRDGRPNELENVDLPRQETRGYLLPLKAAVRTKEKIELGNTVAVTIELLT